MIADGYVKLTDKWARLYFLSFNVLMVLICTCHWAGCIWWLVSSIERRDQATSRHLHMISRDLPVIITP